MTQTPEIEFTEGDHYEFEIAVAGREPEVFRADTERELVEKLARAHFRGSKLIVALKRENKMLRGVIYKLQSAGRLTQMQESQVAQILETYRKIAGLRERSK